MPIPVALKDPLRIHLSLGREKRAHPWMRGLDLLAAREPVVREEIAAAAPQRVIDEPAEVLARARQARCAGSRVCIPP